MASRAKCVHARPSRAIGMADRCFQAHPRWVVRWPQVSGMGFCAGSDASRGFACARLSVDVLSAMPSAVMAVPCDGALSDGNRQAWLATMSLSRAVTSGTGHAVSLAAIGREPELDRLPPQDFSDCLRHQPRPIQPERSACGPSRSRRSHDSSRRMTMASAPRAGRWAKLRSKHISKPEPAGRR